MLSAGEIIEAIESFFLMLYLSNNLKSFRIIHYDDKKKCYIVRIKNDVKIFEIFFIKDNILEIRAYNRWVTKNVIRSNILICSDLQKSLDYHHFIYKVEDIRQVMTILSAFSEYVSEIMRSD